MQCPIHVCHYGEHYTVQHPMMGDCTCHLFGYGSKEHETLRGLQKKERGLKEKIKRSRSLNNELKRLKKKLGRLQEAQLTNQSKISTLIGTVKTKMKAAAEATAEANNAHATYTTLEEEIKQSKKQIHQNKIDEESKKKMARVSKDPNG